MRAHHPPTLPVSHATPGSDGQNFACGAATQPTARPTDVNPSTHPVHSPRRRQRRIRDPSPAKQRQSTAAPRQSRRTRPSSAHPNKADSEFAARFDSGVERGRAQRPSHTNTCPGANPGPSTPGNAIPEGRGPWGPRPRRSAAEAKDTVSDWVVVGGGRYSSWSDFGWWRFFTCVAAQGSDQVFDYQTT